MRKPSLQTADSVAKKPASEPWLRRSLSRARAQLTQAISKAPPAAKPATASPQGEAAEETQTVETARGRLRSMLQQDREGPTATTQPSAADAEARRSISPPPLPVRNAEAARAEGEVVRGSAQILADPKLAATKAKLANAKSRLAAAKAQLAARPAREPAAAVEEAAEKPAAELTQPGAADDEVPIRTRTMARLLALQGHPERALSIYDELLEVDTDPKLLAEAEELRGQHTDAG